MKYIVDCRRKNEAGEVEGVKYAGFGTGLPNKKIANEVYNREIKSGKWQAVYMDRTSDGATIKTWYKGT